MRRKKISYVDYAWLRADHPDNLMVITGLITFKGKLDYERFKALVEELTCRFPRFRQRLAPSLISSARPYWENDLDFNLESHLERVVLPAPADQAALQELISEILSIDLEPSHPLWRFYVVEEYQPGGSALVVRLHHALADGIALVHVLLSMTEKDVTTEFTESTERAENKKNRLVSELVEKAVRLLTEPGYARQAARFGADFATAVGKLALRPPDPRTLFKGRLGKDKRAAWSEPFNLRAVKRVGRAYGCTVNDVLLSAMAGALGRYIAYRGRSTEGLSIRSLIPVNLRILEEIGSVEMDENLGNEFGLVFLSLPVGVDDPVERLRKLKKNMNGLKNSKEPLASLVILKLIGAAPASAENLAFSFFDTKGTTIMTNVPGPRQQLTLAGAPIEMLMAWVPQSGRVGLGVSIVSYNGSIWVGVATDRGLVPDPEQIVAFFKEEYDALTASAEAVLKKRYRKVQPVMSQLDGTLRELDDWLKKQH